MAAVSDSAAVTGSRHNLFTRLVLVVTSPGAAYAEVAAKPAILGALAVVVAVMAICPFLFLSTAVGQEAMIDQQISTMETFGMTITPEMEARLKEGSGSARYTTAISQVIFVPLAAAVIAGLLLGIFNATSEGSSTFKHVYALVVHSAIVLAVQQIVMTPISYLMGEFATVTRLSVFFPVLETDSFLSYLFGGIELFTIWWLLNLSIGIAVLYRRPTRGVTIALLGIYAAIVLCVAVVRVVI